MSTVSIGHGFPPVKQPQTQSRVLVFPPTTKGLATIVPSEHMLPGKSVL